ncbi:MAG TPA: polyprenol monophosphomannose synthase [Terrimesophilobacter sp.]|jgi:Glycosyltransferases involved in cell wall biogenesis|uniref:polyprenol monophosphomannose synthase n=1 Tax=Terrimesophilobacter sp. TaxID=2906435 RepID=UPI002F94E38E
MSTTLVIIPTYNERENLRGVAGRVLAQGADVLVVDDNSPDGTGAIAEELAARDPRVHVLHRAGKEGLGAAYRQGFVWGLDRGYDVLVELDGDGSHQPEQLGRLLGRMSGADVVVGSRWVAGGSVVNWPFRRALLSRAGSLYARIALGIPFRDVTGGYRAYSARALRQIDLGSIASQGYCFQIDMLWHAHRAGLRIAEVPITFVEREFGVSKMSSHIVREAILNVTLWGLEALPFRILAALHPALRAVDHRDPAHVS